MIQETFPMIVGGDDVPNERILLSKVESGLMMSGADAVRFLIVHCSATRCDRDYTVEQMLRDHKAVASAPSGIISTSARAAL